MPELATFFGPLASVERVEDPLRFLGTVLGLAVRGVQRFERADVESLWGVSRRTAGLVWIEHPATGRGMALLQFDPGSRQGAPGAEKLVASDILRAVEVLVRDEKAVTRAALAMGLEVAVRGEGKLPEVEMADGIVTSLRASPVGATRLGGTRSSAEDVLGVEVAVSDPVEMSAFYRLLEVPHRLVNASPSVAEAEDGLMVGPRVVGSSAASLKGKWLPPRRGLVGLVFDTESVAEIQGRVEGPEGRGLGCQVVSVARGLIHPRGAIESLLVRAPSGILHQFVARR